MPTALHDLLVQMFAHQPELVLELARQLGLELPAAYRVSDRSADLSTLVSTELRADLVLALEDAAGVTRLAIIVEVQLGRDPDKRYTWPLYATSLRHRLRCPVLLVVFTRDARVARWAARPIQVGPGVEFRPLVIGPDLVPVITDTDRAQKEPERAVLSALVHLGDLEVARVAIWAVRNLADERMLAWIDTILSAVGPEAAQRLKEIEMQNYEWQSDFAKKYVGEGRVEGRVEGEAESLLIFLRARGFEIDEALEQRVRAERDLETLETWIRRAAMAVKLDDVFGAGG